MMWLSATLSCSKGKDSAKHGSHLNAVQSGSWAAAITRRWPAREPGRERRQDM